MNNGIHRSWPAIALLLIGSVYVVASLATIKTYQLPWFDEIVYIDAARSFQLKGTFHPSILSLRPETLHSPLFSVLTAWMFDLFGFGIVQARILPMIGAISVLIMLSMAVHSSTGSKGCMLVFMLLFISDRTVNFAMHNGRMDMLSLAFATASLLWFGRLANRPSSTSIILKCIAAGLILSAAYLTSMRLAVAMAPCVLLPLCFRPKVWKSYLHHLFCYGFSAGIPVALWLWHAYGSIPDAVESTSSTANYEAHFGLLNSFVGNVLRRVNEAPKMFLFYVLCIWLLIRHRKTLQTDFFVCANLLTLAGFVLFVTEKGPYRAMFLPFMYYLGATSIYIIHSELVRKWVLFTCIAVIGLNIAYSTPRIAYLAYHYRNLDPKQAGIRLAKQITAGDRVISDMQFYYILREIGAEIRVVELDKLDLPAYKNSLIADFKPNFILSNQPKTLELLPGRTLATPITKNDFIHPLIDRILHSESTIMPKEAYHAQLVEIH